MLRKFPKLSLIIAICLALSCFSACSLFKKDDQAVVDQEAAEILEQDEQVDAKKNERGMSQRDEDFLNFGEERLAKLITAFNAFGEGSKSYQSEIIDKGSSILSFDKYRETRDNLLEACSKLETIPLSTVPEKLKNFYDQNFRMANHCRQMIYQIERTNGVELTTFFNNTLQELNQHATQAKAFIAAIDSQGIDAAQSAISPLDWAAEAALKPVLTSTFDTSELGLPFGVSRAQVMGVEGLIKDYDKLEKLEYNCEVYVYKGVRKYYFNEFDQLYRIVYEFRPNDMNPYNDLRAIFHPIRRSFMVPDYFVDAFESAVQGPNDAGQHYFQIDLPHLDVTIKATDNHPEQPLLVDVQGKLATESKDSEEATDDEEAQE